MKTASKRSSTDDLRLSWLTTFVSVSRHENRSASAKELSIAQGTVTKHLQSLERWLRMPLVHDHSAPTRLTAQGKAFLEEAERVLEIMARARMPLAAPAKPREGISAKGLRVPPSVPDRSRA